MTAAAEPPGLSAGVRFPRLTEGLSADVCVVGAGLTGLWTALEAAERGASVLLLEAGRLGQGGSGRNGGQVVTGLIPGPRDLTALLGAKDGRRLWSLALEAKQALFDRIARHGIACDLCFGQVLAAVRPKHLPMLRDLVDGLAEMGYQAAELVDREGLRALVAAERGLGGLYDREGAHLDPVKLVHGLADAACANGRVRLFEESKVTSVTLTPNPIARTATGLVTAGALVLACDGAAGRLLPGEAGWTVPVYSSVAVTEPLGAERAAALIPGGVALTDLDVDLMHYRLTADHRLLFGGGADPWPLGDRAIRRRQARRMGRVFPQLHDLRIDKAWAGTLPATRLLMPRLARPAPSVYLAEGFSGQGLVLSALAGRSIAEAIAGRPDSFALLADLPHRRVPGGRWGREPARVAGLLWTMLKHRL